MIIRCPKCEVRHDASARPPGQSFSCTCGHPLRAPRKGGLTWLVVLGIMAACAVPCVGIVAAVSVPNYLGFKKRSKATEAKVNLRAIAVAEVAYFQEYERFVAAGPVPAQVPRGEKLAWPTDPGFEAIAWRAEGPVRYQYEVRLADGGAVIVARGDLDGDGRTSEYRLAVTRDGPVLPIEERDPLE